MKKLIVSSSIAIGLAVAVLAGDGVWRVHQGNYNWPTYACWLYDTIAGEGGVARLTSCPTRMNLTEDLTLGGIFFEGSQACTFTNTVRTLTLQGPIGRLQCNNATVTMNTPLRGTGGNVIEKGGVAPFVLGSKVTNAAGFSLTGGSLASTKPAEDALSEIEFLHKSGYLSYAPTAAGTMTLKKLSYGPGRADVLVNDAKGAATVAVGELACSNGVLVVNPASGIAALGETEKVTVTKAPTLANGMMDATVAVFDSLKTKGGDSQMLFATYDATKGIIPAADPVAWNTDADQSAQSVKLTSATTLAAEKAVHALTIDSTTGSIQLDAPLVVGDGSTPAGIIVNNVGSGAFTLNVATNLPAGVIDFGDAPGVFWIGRGYANSMPETKVNLTTGIRSTKGVTFAGAPAVGDGNALYNLSDVPAEWASPTVICGARVILTSAVALPEGDVYVTGYDAAGQGGLRITKSVTFSDKYRFHLSGSGLRAGDYGRGVIHLGGGNTTVRFNGETEIRDQTWFTHDGTAYMVWFAGPVTGVGSFVQSTGNLRLSGVNTFSGDLIVNGTVEIYGAGTLGTGRVTGGGTLKFNECPNLVVTNNIALTGRATFAGGHVILKGARQTFAKTTFTGGAIVEYGPDVDFGTITTDGTVTFKPLDGAAIPASIKIGGADDTLLSGQKFDGVNVIKTGANTVTIPVETFYSGKLSVVQGTVKLSGDVFSSGLVSYWLDASKTDTVLADGTSVTNWLSANGNGIRFNKYGNAPTTGELQNGLNVLRFTNDGSHYCRFNSTKSLTQRTVYTVVAPEKPDRWEKVTSGSLSVWGWTGKGSPEYAFRYQGYTSGWGVLTFPTIFRRNGVVGAYAYAPDGKWQVIGVLNTNANKVDEYYDTFPVSVGGYESWNAGNNFNGRIAEVLAFNRVLDETERKAVENYLAQKWGLEETVWHEGVEPFAATVDHDVLAVTTELELSEGGVFDLNGISQTVASLSGAGQIVNSSVTPAKLTVTGDFDFSGTIGAGVEIVKAGDGDDVFNGTVNGGVTAKGGSLSVVGAYLNQPPTDGLLLWLDAASAQVVSADKSTLENAIVTNKAGGITKWYCREKDTCTVKSFANNNSAPIYKETGFNGIAPSAYFNGNNFALRAAQTCSPKTLVFMYWTSATTTAYNYLFSYFNSGDSGVRLEKSTMMMSYSYCFGGSASFSKYGDFLYSNGTRINLTGGDIAGAQPFGCLIFTRGDWHQESVWAGKNLIIGSFAWSHGNSNFHLGEVLGYDRVLSDKECLAVTKYLTDKWTGAALPQPQGGIAATAKVVAGGEATVDLSAAEQPVTLGAIGTDAEGGTIIGDVATGLFVYDAQKAATAQPLVVEGDLTLTEGAEASFADYRKLKIRKWDVLKATGDVSGAFETTDLTGLFGFGYADGVWSLTPFSGMLWLK